MSNILRSILVAALALLAGLSPAMAEQTPPPGAKVFFENLSDGDVVKSPVLVKFGAVGVKVMKVGIDLPGVGHHHLLVNVDIEDEDRGFALPATDKYLHFAGGQAETELYLAPGQHTLRLVFADTDHVPYYPWLMSDLITITVEE